MQRQLSLLETRPSEVEAAVWAALDDEGRAKVLEMLARLVAKAAVNRDEVVAEETGDE